MIAYRYKFEGHNKDGEMWNVQGSVDVYREGDFFLAMENAKQEAMTQVMKGNVTSDQSGLCCNGPYTITKFVFTRTPDA